MLIKRGSTTDSSAESDTRTYDSSMAIVMSIIAEGL